MYVCFSFSEITPRDHRLQTSLLATAMAPFCPQDDLLSLGFARGFERSSHLKKLQRASLLPDAPGGRGQQKNLPTNTKK
jgi:hypothetical protein